MRNLLGRLHARPPEELGRIAAFWRVPIPEGAKHRQIGQLYRALTDPRAGRDAWDRLAADERALVGGLALTDEAALTLAELADRLDLPEADVRRTAARLYHTGIVAREGDDNPLPVGAAPRLFLPRELALLFRRVQDELDAGDLSATPLRALLELLDDAELEEAAGIWGIRVIPGLRGRADLTDQLLRQVADADRVAAVAAAVGRKRRESGLIWRRVRAGGSSEGSGDGEKDRRATGGGGVRLAEVAAEVELTRDDARTAQRLRDGLADLESALLVWHTYAPGGERRLFVPAEIRAPRARAGSEPPALAPLAAETVAAPPWRHPDALAWDLLTLLRALADVDAPRVAAVADLPRAWSRRLNRRLWVRGEDAPPAGYLDLLLALALAEGLLVRRHPADAPDDEPVLTLAPGIRAWRDLSFPDQTPRLRERWLALPEWIEAVGRGELAVWGADWRGFRRKLLGHLAALPTVAGPGSGEDEPGGAWFALDAVAAWVAARDPDLLGATFTAASARRPDRRAQAEADHRRAAIADAIVIAAETALGWFGIVELAATPGQPRAIRATMPSDPAEPAAGDASRAPSRQRGLDLGAADPDGPPIRITAGGEVRLRRPSPVRVWSLATFAEPVALGRESAYRLTEAGLGRALAAGFDLAQVTAFLERQSGGPLPDTVAADLATWAHGYRRVRVRRAIVLTPDDPAALAEIRRLVASAGHPLHDLGDATLVVEFPNTPRSPGDPDPAEALLDRLRAAGHAPQWGTAPPSVTPRTTTPEPSA